MSKRYACRALARGAAVALALAGANAHADTTVGHSVLSLAQWDARMGGPATVTLKGAGCSQRDIRKALATQTGAYNVFRAVYNESWNDSRYVDLDLVNVPFWQAVREVAAASEQNIQCLDQSMEFVTAYEHCVPTAPYASFMVLPSRIERNASRQFTYPLGAETPPRAASSLTVQILVCFDPRAAIGGVEQQAAVQTAVDEKGRSLLLPAPRTSDRLGYGGVMPGIERGLMTTIGVPLRPDIPATKIARLTGTVRVRAYTGAHTWKVTLPEDGTTVENRSLPDADGVVLKAHITDAAKAAPRGARTVEITYNTPGRGNGGYDETPFTRVRFTDASGAVLAVRSMEYYAGDKDPPANTGSQGRRVSFGEPIAKGQITLEWTVPTHWDYVDAPFDFRDLPMPTFNVAFPDLPGAATAPPTPAPTPVLKNARKARKETHR